MDSNEKALWAVVVAKWMGLATIAFRVFAVGALVTSFRWGSASGAIGEVLVDIGDLAFGGFAQLALPVIVALYWERTTRDGVIADVPVPQIPYVAFNFAPETTVAVPGVALFGLDWTNTWGGTDPPI